jgi:hypothetical protein
LIAGLGQLRAQQLRRIHFGKDPRLEIDAR